MICLSNLCICLLILLTIFDISFMETFSEDTCGADNDMFRWFEQMGNFAERYQVNTDHITETHAKIHLLEQKMDETKQNIQEIKRILIGMQKNCQTQNTFQDNIEKPNSIIVQRRMDGSENFYRTWNEYKHGFGDIGGEFFIGLQKLYELTNSDRYELIITMEDFEKNTSYAKYDHFVIGSEAEKYVLKSLGNYNGMAGDSLKDNLGKKFTTRDQDNDDYAHNCANSRHGAWWYWNCSESNLTGKYSKDANNSDVQNMYWQTFKQIYPLKFVEMRLRKFDK